MDRPSPSVQKNKVIERICICGAMSDWGGWVQAAPSVSDLVSSAPFVTHDNLGKRGSELVKHRLFIYLRPPPHPPSSSGTGGINVL